MTCVSGDAFAIDGPELVRHFVRRPTGNVCCVDNNC